MVGVRSKRKMESLSINVSPVDDREEQQIVTLVDAGELNDDNELVQVINNATANGNASMYLKSHNSHCLICNGKLVVSARGAMDIFSKEAKTSSRSLDLDFILGSILNRELTVANIHSSVICKKCFKLIDDIDCIEGQLISMKQDLANKFLQTEARIKHSKQNTFEREYNCITDGDKAYTVVATKSRSKRSRRVRSKKTRCSPALVKVEVKEESEDILASCFSLDDTTPEMEDHVSEVVVEDNRGNICNLTTVFENIYDIDGLDLHNNDSTVQIGDLVLPTINSDETANRMALDMPGIFAEKNLEKFRCRFCQLRKHTVAEIHSHIYEFHATRIFECEVCEQQLNDHSELVEHLQHHVLSNEKPYSCQLCRRSFSLPRQLREHMRHHLCKSIECYKCLKKFRSESSLEEHMHCHTGVRPYTCEHCYKRFASKPVLKSHLKIHGVRNRPFKCKNCHKLFLTSHHLNDHMQIHENTKGYICETCGKAFSTQRSVDLHSITHSGIKNFVCRICNKAFARKGEVDDHERTHTGEKPFQCEICGAQFCQRSNLQTHKRSTHLKEKRYICDQCDKAFKRRRLLVYHIMSIHTGERPYKCDYCTAAFVYPEHYKKHLRIHTGEKPFSCEICGKAFNSRDNKNAHKFIHSSRKQYECTLCGLGFMRKPLLTAHISQHGRVENVDSCIKVNPASIVDEEMITGMLSDSKEHNVENNIGLIQLVRSTETESTVQVLNRPIIVNTDIPRYILEGHVVEVRSDELEELTATQSHMAEVAAQVSSTSDPSVDSSEHIQQDSGGYQYFQLHLSEEDKELSNPDTQGTTGANSLTRITKTSLSSVERVSVGILQTTFKKVGHGPDGSASKVRTWNQ